MRSSHGPSLVYLTMHYDYVSRREQRAKHTGTPVMLPPARNAMVRNECALQNTHVVGSTRRSFATHSVRCCVPYGKSVLICVVWHSLNRPEALTVRPLCIIGLPELFCQQTKACSGCPLVTCTANEGVNKECSTRPSKDNAYPGARCAVTGSYFLRCRSLGDHVPGTTINSRRAGSERSHRQRTMEGLHAAACRSCNRSR